MFSASLNRKCSTAGSSRRTQSARTYRTSTAKPRPTGNANFYIQARWEWRGGGGGGGETGGGGGVLAPIILIKNIYK